MIVIWENTAESQACLLCTRELPYCTAGSVDGSQPQGPWFDHGLGLLFNQFPLGSLLSSTTPVGGLMM